MGYLTEIFYRNETLSDMLVNQNDSNKIQFIGLTKLSNDILQVTIHRTICLRNQLEIYNYNLISGQLTYEDKYILHPQYSFDAYRSNYMEIIEG